MGCAVEVVGTLGGGNRNHVLEVRIAGRRLVARRSGRDAASLEWEVALLDHLASHGLRAPALIAALDGRRHIAGITMQTWLDGALPQAGDWPVIAATLRKLRRHDDGHTALRFRRWYPSS